MLEATYYECPRCKGVKFSFQCVSSFSDELGYIQTCKGCSWYNKNRFYDKDDIKLFKKELRKGG